MVPTKLKQKIWYLYLENCELCWEQLFTMSYLYYEISRNVPVFLKPMYKISLVEGPFLDFFYIKAIFLENNSSDKQIPLQKIVKHLR